jgi:hypothetical protein
MRTDYQMIANLEQPGLLDFVAFAAMCIAILGASYIVFAGDNQRLRDIGRGFLAGGVAMVAAGYLVDNPRLYESVRMEVALKGVGFLLAAISLGGLIRFRWFRNGR